MIETHNSDYITTHAMSTGSIVRLMSVILHRKLWSIRNINV